VMLVSLSLSNVVENGKAGNSAANSDGQILDCLSTAHFFVFWHNIS
jgi:hypothetical protein